MTPLPECDLSTIPLEEIDKPRNLRQISNAVMSDNCGIPPDVATAFLGVDPYYGHAWSRIAKNLITSSNAVILGGGVASYPALEMLQSSMGNWPKSELPETLAVGLRAFLDLAPLRSEVEQTAEFFKLAPAIPFTLALALVSGRIAQKAVTGAYRWGLSSRIETAQQMVREMSDNGTMRWHITSETAVGLVGRGDPLAMALTKRLGSDLIQIASERPAQGYWTSLDADTLDADIIKDAYGKADLKNARRLEIYPITPNYEFLPGQNNYDISVDRIPHYINIADASCCEDDVPLKPVVIIGRKTQRRDYGTIGMDGTLASTTVNLDTRMNVLIDERNELRQLRGEEIDDQPNIIIIDPTELVMNKIIHLAEGRPIELHGTNESCAAFSHQFTSMLRERHYEPTGTDPVRVVYNLNDAPTLTEATAHDIAVIVDPNLKNTLTSEHRSNGRRIPEEQIIVVTDEILKLSAFSDVV